MVLGQTLQAEEVASEEPLARFPVRVLLRTAGVNLSDRVGGGFGSARGLSDPASSQILETPSVGPADAGGSLASEETQTPTAGPELSSTWQVAEELGRGGRMAAPRYLLVRLGECIPAETGAAPVHLSRLDAGTQWRDFLNDGAGRHLEGLALDESLSCPCCLSIFRQPIALPCGHSLCRSCYARISAQAAAARRCPLCRADLPQCELRVNLALGAVCDALRAFRAVSRQRPTQLADE